ncbi:serpin family protein [Endozoicomonas acroporae]|uniref:serpin family protein n=1 Tax=Endozoicomonas acroporae TaxID=1701104 RepID=UPI0013D2F40C|nr:serpin family protein [Endozoicomonas acroporae]
MINSASSGASPVNPYRVPEVNINETQPDDLSDCAKTIVQNRIRQLSFALINPAGKGSTALSTASLASALGMLLAAIDDAGVKEKILGMTNQSLRLTTALEKEIHKQLGQFCLNYTVEKSSQSFIVNYFASDDHCQDSNLIDLLSKYYNTTKLEITAHDKVADVTDTFIKSITNGRISSLFTPDERDDVNLSMGNVVCLKAIWADAFDKFKTARSGFQCSDGKIAEVEMMESEPMNLKCAFTKDYAAIAKPFQHDTEKLYFVAITPINSSSSGINHLDTETLHQLIDQSLEAKKQKITLKLPKMKIDSTDTSLLKEIGKLSDIKITADMLSKLGKTRHDHLDMRQKIHAIIDEEGAEVVSTTAVNRKYRGGNFEPPEPFNFDCPGYIAIIVKDDNGKHLLLESIIKDASYLVPAESKEVQPPSLSARSVQTHQGSTVDTDSLFRPAKNDNGAKSLKNSDTSLQNNATHLFQNLLISSVIQIILNKDKNLKIFGVNYDQNNQELLIQIKDFTQAQILSKKIIDFTNASDSGNLVSAVDFNAFGKNNFGICTVVNKPLTALLLEKLFNYKRP